MAATRPGQTGRLAEFNSAVRAGATLPKTYSASVPSTAAATITYKFKVRAAGVIDHISAYANTLTTSVTIDVLKNGASVLVAAKAVTAADTTLELEGLGTDVSGPYQNINTNTDTNKRKLRYEDGDEITISIVTVGAAATGILVVVSCDEQQKF